MPLPAATFDPTKMVVGRQSIISITPAGGSATHLLCEYVSHNPGQTIARAAGPGASNGPSFTAKVWESGRAEMLKFRTKEIHKVVVLLGSLSALKKGTATAYIRDPDDAANTVAHKTDDFPCAIYRDQAEAEFSAANPTEITLVLESTKDGPIDFDSNASTA